jgi:hypothetical protein
MHLPAREKNIWTFGIGSIGSTGQATAGIFAGADVIRLFGAKPFEDLVWTFSGGLLFRAVG